MTKDDSDRVARALGWGPPSGVAHEAIRALACAPADAVVTTRDGPFSSAVISAEGEGISSRRVIVRADDGPVLVGLRLFLSGPLKGRGADLFQDMAGTCTALGIRRILATAAGDVSSWMNGYYTWPRLGFDGRIPDGPWRKMPQHLRDLCGPGRQVMGLMVLAEGRSWWREHGSVMDVWFDTRPESPHHLILRQYLRERTDGQRQPARPGGVPGGSPGD